MKTLLIEEPEDTFREFIAGVRAATGSVIIHEDTIPRGLQRFASSLDDIHIAVCTIDRDPVEAIRFVKKVRSVAHQAMVSTPRIVILTREPQPEWALDTFERLGVDHLLRSSPEVFEKLRLIRWQLRSKKSLPTLYIMRRHGHVAAVGFLPTNR